MSNRWRSPSVGPLSPGPDVHLWRASLRQPATRVAELRRTLSPDERARQARLRLGRDRRRWAVGRGFLRHVLARYAQTSPDQVTFQYGKSGKPHLQSALEGGTIHFNASHSGDLLLIAVSGAGPIGVDVEEVRPMANVEAMARRWLTRKEWAEIRAAPVPERSRLFLAAWTRMEARAKALGLGLWGVVGRPAVGEAGDLDVANEGPHGTHDETSRALRPHPRQGGDARRPPAMPPPLLLEIDPGPGFVGALALVRSAFVHSEGPQDKAPRIREMAVEAGY